MYSNLAYMSVPISVSQFVGADLHMFFQKSDSRVLDSASNLVCGVSRTRVAEFLRV
jgi:hypothetical protein